jgi:NAD-dependent histone deacetylase SIR2
MGQEESVPINEDVPPQTLTSRTLDGVALYLKSGRARKVVVMVRKIYIPVGVVPDDYGKIR